MPTLQTIADIEVQVRAVLARHTRITDPQTIPEDQDLYAAGLTSFNAVQMMLSLESEFGIVFPSNMLNRRSFSTVHAIVASLDALTIKSRVA